MTTVKIRFDGQVFVPEQPVSLPVGFLIEIPLSSPRGRDNLDHPLTELTELVDQFPENSDWSADGAAQHDHYLYGTPKRDNP